MAVVLPSEESDFFSPSPLKRSHSQSKFVSKSPSGLQSSASTSRISDAYHANYQPYHIAPSSSPSSAPSSPRTIHADSVNPSYFSTPATSISLDGHCEDDLRLDTDDVILPTYDASPFFASLEDLESPTSPHAGDSYTVSPAENDTSDATTSRPESPTLLEHAEDDTALRHHPTQHVDYLSHDWKEEDIWSSWRYIISRRSEYTNSARLENASWRTWMKSKYGLKTISPETLNWLKDCDVTWLYGPLSTRHAKLFPDTEQGSDSLSRNDSFVRKKPILKKRSMSEVMLQKSISTSSLLKQATASVQAQQEEGRPRITRPILSHRVTADYITFPLVSRRISRESTALLPSDATSGNASPSVERKHIHFDEQVTQCIAVEIKGDEEEEEDDDTDPYNYEDSDSDDGVFMMNTKKKTPFRPRPKSRHSFSGESRTIAMLPSTTLKYREDTPEPPDTAMKHSKPRTVHSPLVSPSSSQETLRPSKQSGRFFVGDDDDDDDDEDEYGDTDGSTISPTNTSLQPSRQGGLQRSTSTSNLAAEPAGMRRTESGMFMPYEDGDDQDNEGIIGRVIDTVNTARDIAHVIWNVGWRK